jgi:hypothetical protein
MSDDFYDVVQFKPKKKGDGKWALKLGYARPREGGGFWVTLDALPLGDGSIAIVPQREKGAGAATKRPDDLEDSVPF